MRWRSLAILGFFIFAGLLAWVYMATRLPPGVEAKGGAQDWEPLVSLAGAVVSLIGGLVTLTVELVKLRTRRLEPANATRSRVRSR
jgi:hypothetical protein